VPLDGAPVRVTLGASAAVRIADEETGLRPVQIALRLLETLGAIQPSGVSEIARALELPKSTVQRSLLSLNKAGWIEPSAGDPSLWVLSLQALLATVRADIAARPLRAASIPVMEDLRRATQESVYLAVLHKRSIALAERMDGIRPVAHAWPLWRSGPLHRTSLGKSILAAMGEMEASDYIASLPARSSANADALRVEVSVARNRGFAVALGSNYPDENGVGAAIRNARGAPIGAISISAPKERLSEEDCLRIGPQVRDAARRISMGLIHAPNS
jgi:IclR family transcriptional regulator, acetate operon repressor